jgi:hypothetical protein
MTFFQTTVDFISKNLAVIMTILFLLSELIGENKKIAASSVFGSIRNFLKGESQKALPQVEKAINNQ